MEELPRDCSQTTEAAFAAKIEKIHRKGFVAVPPEVCF